MKKQIFIALLLLSTAGSVKAAETTASVWDDPMVLFYVVSGFAIIVSLLALVVVVYVFQIINIFAKKAAEEKAKRLGIEYQEPPSWWEKFWQKSNYSVPLEQENTILLDHSYDGIKELDNHLPPWWKGLFYGSMVFAVVYMFFFHITNSMPLPAQEYEQEVMVAEAEIAKIKAASPVAAIDENNVAIATEADALADGKQVFLNNCSTCHRKDGGGDIGPNLTDEYWLHGGSINDIFKTVKHGIPATNMISWEGIMSQEKIRNVASYVLTLKGSNPPNPKKYQGEIYKAKPQEAKSDSTKSTSP